ncbi:MAG: SMC-Scp complex subunit ScpB [Fuerstiella sp.]|jgi:segregation and condensation protein B
MSGQSADDSQPINDIELAYREALRSIDEAELQVGSALRELASDDEGADFETESAFASIGDDLADELAAEVAPVTDAVVDGSIRVSPRAVIEAALFVGGEVALTGKRLASLIGTDTDARVAVKLIDELNESYAFQNRPYEIRLHEGGFRMELKPKFANVQLKVFGIGPREVKLSPEVLEVLAFVAYNQPVTKQDLDSIQQRNALTHVRRLIRLQVVEVERVGSRRSDVAYVTGERFLELFGLTSLDELPQADVFSFK